MNDLLLRLTATCGIWLCMTCFSVPARAQEKLPCKKVVYEFEKELKEVTGEVVVEAVDGGLLLRTSDGKLVVAQPDEIKRKEDVEAPFHPLTQDEIAEQLLLEMPQGFKIHKTPHFVFCYDTTEAYVKWTGALYEKLYRGFYKFWKDRGIKLEEPRFPLVALVFQSKQSYLRYAAPELGRSADSVLGYYNLMSNRITTFDLTGIEGRIPDGMRVDRIELVNRILMEPGAERSVATIVHEAVHQLAYNSGLQVRLADNPPWVSEGLAVFFETPDFSSGAGWGAIGKVNKYNLIHYRDYKTRRPINSLLQLLSDDDRFRNAAKMQDAYAECWALNYYLIKKKPKEYSEYLKFLSKQKPLEETDPKQRIVDFQEHFGDIKALDRDFQKFIDLQQ